MWLLVASNAGAQDHGDGGRVRGGFDAAGGVGVGAGASGPLYGLRARLGWQFNRRIAAYVQGDVFWWDSSEISGRDGATGKGSIGLHVTPMLSLTSADVVEIAAGPSLDRLAVLSSSVPLSDAASRDSLAVYAHSYPGAHGRVAVHVFGHPETDTDRRTSFAIGGDIHTTFAAGIVVAFFTIGVGAEWY
jgi:hypothetical protein